MNFDENQAKGSFVVVRSNEAGVFGGELINIEGDRVSLKNARKAWSWAGAFAVEGLAAYGPSSGKLSAKIDSILVFGVCQLLLGTEEAETRWSEVKEFKP